MPLLTGNYLKVMRQQWKDIEFIFIDEISMVPYEMLCMIDSRLRQPSGEFALNKAIRIFPLRQQVDDHNAAVLDYYREQSVVQIFNIRAQDRPVEARND
jgi:hypothetical protein